MVQAPGSRAPTRQGTYTNKKWQTIWSTLFQETNYPVDERPGTKLNKSIWKMFT
jgi:hypothetical protein